MVYNIDACNIQWNTNQDWTTNRYFTYIDEVQNLFKDVKGKGKRNYRSRRDIYFEDLNTELHQAI